MLKLFIIFETKHLIIRGIIQFFFKEAFKSVLNNEIAGINI